MTTEITRKKLHSVIDDAIENGADTLIITSKDDDKIHLVVGHFDAVEYEWISTKITTELRLINEVKQ